ncbi:class I SAM-dependent methyltransferase [Dactylosporangium sp. AC04546]|uniref:class I SAM-dependent methyltransferase n=1 Tax=Dactylosporangium sp. AC04546 TaxID=2862460 RepID=UPI001EDD131E|nr:class I SAM-dependent methyltransferase [Dactylosporangium sp. AC04546]WVK87743.1 class I SAM-dependent methyltransferase [Dactylosporangium sp. AC04546]
MSRVYDRVAGQYDATRGGEARGVAFAADLAPWLVPGTVLEVAVGTGVVAKALRARGFTVMGADLSAPMLGRARERLGPVVVRADARRLPFASGGVDNVVFAMALHAIGDLPETFAEAARVTRAGGRVVATHGQPHYQGGDDLVGAVAPLGRLQVSVRPDSEEAVGAAARGAGLELVELRWTEPAPVAVTPAELADRIEGRLYSYLWDVDDATWAAVVAPAVAALRGLPGPHRPRETAEVGRIGAWRVA